MIHAVIIDSKQISHKLRENLETVLSVAGFTRQDRDKPNISVWSIPGDTDPNTILNNSEGVINHTPCLFRLAARWELNNPVPYVRLIKVAKMLAARVEDY